MSLQRSSYRKTTLAALAAAVVLFALVGCTLVLVPWTLARWTLAIACAVLGSLSVLVAIGGFYALQGDARETQAMKRMTQSTVQR